MTQAVLRSADMLQWFSYVCSRMFHFGSSHLFSMIFMNMSPIKLKTAIKLKQSVVLKQTLKQTMKRLTVISFCLVTDFAKRTMAHLDTWTVRTM